MSRTQSLSPYAPHNSVFEKTQARNALRLRERFQNNATPPCESTAAALLERLYAVYQAARLEYGYQKIKNATRGPTRAYGGQRGKLRQVAPASVRSPQAMSPRELMYYKLHQTNWAIPTGAAPSDDAVAAGIARLRAQLVQEDSAPLGEPSANEHETVAVHRSLSPRERFAVLDNYHEPERASEPRHDRVSAFIDNQREWRKSQSWHACLILSQFENDLKNPRKFRAADLYEIERRFLVGTLPSFGRLRHIQTRTARIAIAMVSAVSLSGTSKSLVIDQTLAAMVAAKYNAFLARQRPARKTP